MRIYLAADDSASRSFGHSKKFFARTDDDIGARLESEFILTRPHLTPVHGGAIVAHELTVEAHGRSRFDVCQIAEERCDLLASGQAPCDIDIGSRVHVLETGEPLPAQAAEHASLDTV